MYHVTLRLLILCGSHTIDREALYQQAGKAKNATQVLPELQNMEKTRPEEFLEHLEHFSAK